MYDPAAGGGVSMETQYAEHVAASNRSFVFVALLIFGSFLCGQMRFNVLAI
jgi:hypothetical protein